MQNLLGIETDNKNHLILKTVTLFFLTTAIREKSHGAIFKPLTQLKQALNNNQSFS